MSIGDGLGHLWEETAPLRYIMAHYKSVYICINKYYFCSFTFSNVFCVTPPTVCH